MVITGANGFLGSYIVRVFLNQNYKVIALVRKNADCSSLPENDHLSIERINYLDDLDTQFDLLKSRHGRVDFFIHNAGITVSLNKSEYFDINTHLTGRILKSAKNSVWLPEDGKFIYLSSLAANGPLGINHPISLYGESKMKAEKLVMVSHQNYLIIRPTAVYGPGDYAFLPLFRSAAKGIYPLTNSKQRMSIIHAGDLARIIQKEVENSIGIIHANDGNTYLHNDFVEALKKATGRKITKVSLSAGLIKRSLMLSDVWHSMFDKKPGITKEKFEEISKDWNLHEDKELTFSKIPSQISLEEGFRDTYEFYKNKKLI